MPPVKIARLPNGRTITFPAQADDLEIDRDVAEEIRKGRREQMHSADHEARRAMVGQLDVLAQQVAGVANLMSAVAAETSAAEQRNVALVASEMREIRGEIGKLRASVDGLRQAIEAAVADVVAAMTAPKRIERDDAGRPIGVAVASRSRLMGE